LEGTNTLAYFADVSVTKKRGFILLRLTVHVISLFSSLFTLLYNRLERSSLGIIYNLA
jgi:hypothetical protein